MRPEYLSVADIAIRIGAALIAGMIIGFEREINHHPAGLKTHTLVCLGATLSSLVSTEMALSILRNASFSSAANANIVTGNVGIDISRIAAGVVTGMGFIGAGAIMKSKDGTVVTGITTAATLWVTTCIGLAIGMGYMWMSAFVILAVFMSNIVIKYLESKFISSSKIRTVDIIITRKKETMKLIEDYCIPRRIKIRDFEYLGDIPGLVDNEMAHHLRYTIKTPSGMSFLIVLRDLAMQDNILQVLETPTQKDKKQKQPDSEKNRESEQTADID
ncbi:MAG: MgtC/SapB family protein [Clostridiales bacterium]|jgi:putative Mg2+ transporter-C (MgtC) family protein|nr:MgtC/SapB family protein [Clostridiales bacterium]